jgi:hypothetical protein
MFLVPTGLVMLKVEIIGLVLKSLVVNAGSVAIAVRLNKGIIAQSRNFFFMIFLNKIVCKMINL